MHNTGLHACVLIMTEYVVKCCLSSGNILKSLWDLDISII